MGKFFNSLLRNKREETDALLRQSALDTTLCKNYIKIHQLSDVLGIIRFGQQDYVYLSLDMLTRNANQNTRDRFIAYFPHLSRADIKRARQLIGHVPYQLLLCETQKVAEHIRDELATLPKRQEPLHKIKPS